MAKAHVIATVNGDPVEYLCDTEQTLLDVLRDVLHLTGSKEGCASGDCGACSIIVDGRVVCACLMLAVEAQSRTIETIEGEGAHPCVRFAKGTVVIRRVRFVLRKGRCLFVGFDEGY